MSQKLTIDAPRQISEKRPKMQDSLYAQNLENLFMNIDWMPFFDEISFLDAFLPEYSTLKSIQFRNFDLLVFFSFLKLECLSNKLINHKKNNF